MKKQIKLLVWLILAVAFIGFLDATYLTAKFYSGTELNCGLTGGCNIVTTSEYATVFGFPVALAGSFYYFTVLFLTLFFIDRKNPKILKFFLPLTTLGLFASIYFVYLQLFVINSICIYCMFSAATSTTLFILSAFLFQLSKKENKERNSR